MWPRRSWMRSVKYLAKRVLRLTASPHAIAAGISAGVFASFTPYMGFHFVVAFLVAYIIAGNMIAAAAGTFIGNPLTFPFIWASTFSVGNFILQREPGQGGPHETLQMLKEVDFMHLGFSGVWDVAVSIWEPVLKPMSVGAVPLGIAVGVIFYIITRWAAIAFQKSRRRMLADKARQLKERAMSRLDKRETTGT